MKQKKTLIVRLAVVVMLLLGVCAQASAGNEMTLRKGGSIVGKIESNGDVRIGGSIVGKVESNGDIRKNGSIIGKVEHLSNPRQAAVMYFFGFFSM